ncbi:hypothetical protein GGR58DRAFT_485453 [Xylaria digitata]|nr:hypothetical protein GGR58DRAFT_485453 [Xylaria digitata]
MKARKALGPKALGLLSPVFGRSTGWKQAATVNCILLCVVSVILIGFLIAAAVTGGGIQGPVFFYEGLCKEKNVSYINFFLHLLINILSTLVLASTNFFMQILNAPTREEIDAAHREGTWLEIGVSSARNVLRVSKLKAFCWLGLLVSSIPIHLLFNSTVFETEYRESGFNLTIATDEFLNEGPFFPPGASLGIAEASDPLKYETFPYESYPPLNDYFYGHAGSIRDYTDKESAIMKRLSSVANLGRTWDRIDVSDCIKKYLLNCNGLDRHRDLVLVVDKPGGWKRNEMWQLLELGYDAMHYNSLFWDHLVPANVSNHLFYHTTCTMSPGDRPCQNDCYAALGGNIFHSGNYDNLDSPYPFFGTWQKTGNSLPILRPGSDNLSVQYCLADPLESKCYVGLSTILLFTVTISIVVKSCIALSVTAILPRQIQNPLVTIGDSIASFLEKPDTRTSGSADPGLNKSLINIGLKRWHDLNKRRWTVVPASVWITSYLLFSISITVCLYFLVIVAYENGSLTNALVGGFFASNNNPFIGQEFTLLTGILAANSPQLLLSASYLAYNSLFTRLQMAQEWAMYGRDYYPLRVTDPQGMQRSTYRLQLPYKYSLPLIALSAFLHFLISNTLYVVVSFGGYLKATYDNIDTQSGLPENAAVLIGYSPISLLVVPIVATILITIPIILSFKKLPPNMVIVGSNSLAISAACHASSLSRATLDNRAQDIPRDGGGISEEVNDGGLTETRQRQSSEYTDVESTSMLHNHDPESMLGDNEGVSKNLDVLGRIARSKIRWGVVKMPPEWYTTFTQNDEVEHLSFGVEKDEVSSPEPGRWYA